MTDLNYSVGAIYSRRDDIHGRLGGQQQGGICTPANHPVIIIFTGESGEAHGYADGWTKEGTYRYFGEGQTGDMTFKAGNRAIRDHLADGKDLLMFKTLGKGKGVRYMGQFVCCGFSYEPAPDRKRDMRQAIVFELAPADGEPVEALDVMDAIAPQASLDELRKRALAAANTTPQSKGKEARRSYYQRSDAVRQYVLARASGACEGCKQPAPFMNRKGQPYLEPHHIRRLTDGGPDDPRYVIALCPNCHREVHSGVEGEKRNHEFQSAVASKEGR